MAKIYGLFGAMTGKLADTVMSVRNGEQIARKYQPIVYNPSTQAQVAQRAKLKLLSQLSAVLAPAIAIPRVGAVSARNGFTKVNFPAVTFSNNVADIDITDIKLTKSIVGMLPLVAAIDAGHIAVGVEGGAFLDVDRVVYVLVQKNSDETLRFVESAIGNNSSASFSAQLPVVDGQAYVLAYGVRDNTEAARVLFGDLTAPTAQDIAKIVTTRTLTESDITLTETVGIKVPAAQSREDDSAKKKSR